jgi:hypothetical protein
MEVEALVICWLVWGTWKAASDGIPEEARVPWHLAVEEIPGTTEAKIVQRGDGLVMAAAWLAARITPEERAVWVKRIRQDTTSTLQEKLLAVKAVRELFRP